MSSEPPCTLPPRRIAENTSSRVGMAARKSGAARRREEDRDYLQKCPGDRRLSGNELLSRTRGIYRALGKAETGRIFVCEPPDGEHSGCVRIHVASRCQSGRGGAAGCTLKAASPSGWPERPAGQPASQRGSWNQEKKRKNLFCVIFFVALFFFCHVKPCKRI